MKVREVMNRNVVTINPEASAVEAACRMRDRNVGSLLVVDKGKIIGITTDRLLALAVVGEGLEPSKVKVRDFMSECLISVAPEMDIVKVARLFEELEIRYLPVVTSEKEKLVGVVSVSDIAFFAKDLVDCVFVEMESRARKRRK